MKIVKYECDLCHLPAGEAPIPIRFGTLAHPTTGVVPCVKTNLAPGDVNHHLCHNCYAALGNHFDEERKRALVDDGHQ